jgi:hypothetical protein
MVCPTLPDSVDDLLEDKDDGIREKTEDSSGCIEESTGVILVNQLLINTFRRRLVKHFDICHRKNKLQWPEQLKKTPRNVYNSILI